MKGYIFEYYKYVRYTKDTLADLKKCLPYQEAVKAAEKSILTFGDYDRLKINTIEDFARYRDMSALAKGWIGNRNAILLYELEKKSAVEYREQQDRFGLLYNGKWDQHLFWALTEFPFRNIKREDLDYEKELHDTVAELKKCINEKISKNKLRVNYQIYGTLGRLGLVVLWMADQFTDVLNLVNEIKRTIHPEDNTKKFLSARTLFSKNPCYNNIDRNDKKLMKLKGKALFQITLKRYLKNEERIPVYDKVAKIKAVHTPGEYDVIFEMEAKEAYYLIENNMYFDHDTREYQSEYFQTKVVFAKELQVDAIDETMLLGDDSSCSTVYGEYLEEIKNKYENVRNLMTDKFVKTTGLVDTLDSLICDYRSNVVSAVNEAWADDFSHIFSRNLDCIEQLLKMEKQPTYIMQILRMILNNLKQQIFHVAEAHSLNFENPKCHLRYTGHEDGLMFCYMGIIKEILETAYKLDGCNMQSEIVPVVTADVVPIIESTLYFDKSSYVSGNSKDQQFKILALNLPHVSFYEIPTYFQYMYHEIFHYIVPKNREERDWNIGVMISTIFISDIIEKYLRSELKLGAKAESLGHHLLPHIYMCVTEKYQELHGAIVAEINVEPEKGDRDVVFFISDKYKERVLSYVQEIEKNNFVKICLENVGERLKNPDANLSSMDQLGKIVRDVDKMKQIEKLFSQNVDYSVLVTLIKDNQMGWEERSGKFLEGLKEVAADLPMIELTDMPLSEYLMFYVNCLKNLMITPNDLDVKEEFKEYLRVGIVLDYYSCVGEELNEIEDEFLWKYVAKYFHMHEKKTESLKEQLQRLVNEANIWITFFRSCIHIKKQHYGIFLKQFRNYYSMVGVRERTDMQEVKKRSEAYFGKYRSATQKYANEMREFRKKVVQDTEGLSIERWNEEYRVIKQKYVNAMFEENLKLFQRFQRQKKLRTLSEINEKRNTEKSECDEITTFLRKNSNVEYSKNFNKERIKSYTVSDFESLAREIQKPINLMRDSVRRLFGKNDLRVWYRGQENASYGLISSIARSNTRNKGSFNYLAQYQRFLFGEFKFRSDGASEMLDRSHFSVSDYLALMQHYEVPTNLLDWSENAFTALYFALEKVLTHKESEAKTDASLWIFSPQLYNEAREYMIKHEATKASCKEPAFEASVRTGTVYDGMIPNLSLEHNEIFYDMFLLGNVEYESSNKYGYTKEKTLKENQDKAYLPLAVYTSRLNPRVQAQSGIFIAFNLYAEPCIKTGYDYMSLEKIQEYYMEHCKRAEKEQFLYKITIDKRAVKEIAECLENMGFNKSKIYPELSNIGAMVK